jgi:hypothetical protein
MELYDFDELSCCIKISNFNAIKHQELKKDSAPQSESVEQKISL